MIPANRPRPTTASPARADPPPAVGWQPTVWRRMLAEAVTDLNELLALVGVSPTAAGAAASADFPLRVPRPYIARMRFGDADDPLLRQVLPARAEHARTPGYVTDPLGERQAARGAGLLRKYPGRALVVAAGACAVHCRYCFRRHFPYADHRLEPSLPALAAIGRDSGIREVILSGGDPLLLTDSRLKRLVDAVDAIEHVAILRVHTRLPVVIPQRVTPALTDTLRAARPRVTIVLHFNHPREVDDDCARALAALSPFTLLNQSVLLRGVNDDASTLAALSERLFEVGVLPYYLHMPDAVAGTAHFDVADARACAIHAELTNRLPGYLVPRLVREVPGAPAKQAVLPLAARPAAVARGLGVES